MMIRLVSYNIMMCKNLDSKRCNETIVYLDSTLASSFSPVSHDAAYMLIS